MLFVTVGLLFGAVVAVGAERAPTPKGASPIGFTEIVANATAPCVAKKLEDKGE